MSQSALVIAWVLSVLAATPLEGRFVLEVASVPVAELRVAIEGAEFLYASTHFLEEGPRERQVRLPLGKGAPVPEVLALLMRPKLGCQEVLEERTRSLEKLCVEKAGPREIIGTIAGEVFAAHYDQGGRLSDVAVGSARWVRVPKAVAPPAQSPFSKGVQVPRGPLTLAPPVPGARWLSSSPRGVGDPNRVGRARCLLLARQAVSTRPGSRVSVGLVVERGRAYPHAWVTGVDGAIDPSVLADDPILAERRYLEIPSERSGSFFLQFFDGAQVLKEK